MKPLSDFVPGDHLKYVISTVADGNLSFLYSPEPEVIQNRRKLLVSNNFPENAVSIWVQMKDDVLIATRSTKSNVYKADGGYKYDAVISKERNIPYLVLVADCIAMLLVDKKRTVISLVHGGLANTKLNLNKKVISILHDQFRVDPNDLEAVLSPALQQKSYVYEYFDSKDDPEWKAFYKTGDDGKFYINNIGKSISQLIACGIPEDQIYCDMIDTVTDKRYFSHFRNTKQGVPDEGRFGLVAMLS